MSKYERSKIVIASTLKPLKDARSFYRFALSLRETNKYDINIIGFLNKNEKDEQNVTFHSIFNNQRTSSKRLLIGYKFLRLLYKIKPSTILVTTFELLPMAVFYKIFSNSKLIYDIQENYALNVKFGAGKQNIFKTFAMSLIKVIECCSKPFIDHHIFAEACYVDEFPSIKNFTILENKFSGIIRQLSPIHFHKNRPLCFLMTGTITPSYGSWEAVQWFKSLLSFYPNHRLRIMGHVPIQSFSDKLKLEVDSIIQIEYLPSETPLPYELVLEAYDEADIVLLPYRNLPNISPKLPSKLFECLALGKVFLISPNENWEQIASKYQAGFSVDFSNHQKFKQLMDDIYTNNFYIHGIDEFPFWTQEEAHKLDQLFSK
ncbi:glycosyltransferase [Belliella kenyensis]|uniref:Glycosyltransferase n=1 Tax=Belliella kenyensis TaxID=1472724 RepID=A0ABV8EKE5_9BACT|nr:glycosyltransferase [Belliella kenyensis]MCH7400397.1 glycosyltransferase [Belliella kenyensis]MDN3604585.1 glycosyltransferase [Belliella kenyensis]